MIVPEEALLRPQLPPVPDWFRAELSQVATRNGHPMFRLVDGTREVHYRRGKNVIKHLLTAVKVRKTRYRRKFHGLPEYKIYTTYGDAHADKTHGLSTVIETASIETVVNIGRPCWIVEVYIAPSEVDAKCWDENRFAMLEKNGIVQRIDLLGPFPQDGYYTQCFDVIDSEGNAISPNQQTIDECKRRFQVVSGDSRSVDECVQGAVDDMEKFEQKQLDLMNENFYQYHGLIARTTERAGVIGKPILKEKV